jgi:hypothetical protein
MDFHGRKQIDWSGCCRLIFNRCVKSGKQFMAVTKEQFNAANARGAAAILRGPVARAARYDSRRGLIVIALEGGCEFAFPAALCEGLANAPRTKLIKIQITPNGLGLHWPLLDVDLYVPGLIEGAFGSGRWMQKIGKLGGSSRSLIKAKAARENGKRGGRPRDKVAA